MEAFSDFKSLQESIQSSLVATTRSATHISSEDLGFHRSLDPSLATVLDTQNARLLALAERLLGNAASNTEIVRPRLPDADAVDGGWRGIVDVVDSLLEKADISLDEYTGAVKRLSPAREQTPTRTVKPSRIANALRSQDIPKPQLLFQHVPTNTEKQAFKPLLQSKPHATVSFKQSLQPVKEEDGNLHYPHPYRHEIEQYEYPSFVYTEAEPILYHPFESTTATLVDSEEALQEMLQELRGAKEIAIDLEHHDGRSYIGIVSLMQISTRDRDWVVDTLKPWRRKLQCLNEVFADPKILKVLHGAYMDIMWLQRDLGLYVVGLFDTHYAARALGYTGGSLAFLLKKFVDFDAQKQYQTADWRIRPLPEEMFDYARSDTHFLLYIYDNMRNELLAKSDFSIPNHEKDKIHDVLTRSRDTALQRYENPVYDSERGLGASGWYKMLSRTPALLTKQQFSVFRAVHQWRDEVARQQDDSVHYVMANHNVFSIAKEMPTDKAALFSVAQPTSQTVRLRADELLSVVARAKTDGADGPDMITLLKDIESQLLGVAPSDAPIQAVTSKPAALTTTTTTTATTAPATNGTLLSHATKGDTQPLRSSDSLFWGSAFESSKWQQKRSLRTANIHLSVPLPALTAEIFANPSEAAATPVALTTKAHESPAQKLIGRKDGVAADADDSSVFTLKERSRKRKSDAISHDHGATTADHLATQADEVGLPDEHDEARAAKLARKAAKKAAKQAARDEADARADEQEPAFDYAAAPSVLNATRDDDGGRRKRDKKKDKSFNPFAKAMDAPKGLPRAQRERAGKSMTFKEK
ncbi:hypothetical protein MBLNU459_g7125t1 [Dothideomycetes sp. NU459]